jgi:acyl carrier protein
MNAVKIKGTETNNIKSKIRDFIVDNFLFGSMDNPFADDDSFLETGIIDSTGVLELLEFIELSYSITINDEELIPENLDSLTNLDRFIRIKLGNN